MCDSLLFFLGYLDSPWIMILAVCCLSLLNNHLCCNHLVPSALWTLTQAPPMRPVQLCSEVKPWTGLEFIVW